MYYTSHCDVFSFVWTGGSRKFAAEVQYMYTREQQEKTVFDNLLAMRQNEIEFLDQQIMKGKPDHQVSKFGFFPNHIRIICFILLS
jgi:hypothetical protein